MESTFASGYFSSSEAVFATVCRPVTTNSKRTDKSSKPTFISYKEGGVLTLPKGRVKMALLDDAPSVIGRSQSTREVSRKSQSQFSMMTGRLSAELFPEKMRPFTFYVVLLHKFTVALP